MTNQFSIVGAFIGSNKRRVLACFFLDFAANLFTLLIPLLTAQAVALLFGHSSGRFEVIMDAGLSLPHSFSFLVIVFGLALVTRAVLDYWKKKQRGMLSEDFIFELRRDIFHRHLRLDPGQYTSKGAGRYLLRFSGDMGSVQQFLSKGILQFSADVSLLVAGLALIWWLNVWLGWVVAGWLAVMALLFWWLNRKVGRIEKLRRSRKSTALDFVNRRLSNIQTLQALNRQGMENARFKRRAEQLRRLGYRYSHMAAIQEALFPLVIYGLIGVVLIFGWQGGATRLDPSSLFAVLMILLAWRPVLQRLLRVGLIWKKGSLSLYHIARVFQQPLEQVVADAAPAIYPPKILIFRNLKLNQQTLELSLATGEAVWVGLAEEAERQTLLRYLSRLESPEKGQLFFDVANVSQLDLKDYRRYITLASPTFPLYGATLGEALAGSSSREASEKAALQLAVWKSLFPSLQPLNMDTPLNETASNLTPAQHGLLLLLRSLLTGKPFLVLDHPFKHLDPSAKANVWGILEQELRKRALLFIDSDMDAATTDNLNKKIKILQVK
jgi:ABC-type multidrug transport system fused ATPase/permease subunit